MNRLHPCSQNNEFGVYQCYDCSSNIINKCIRMRRLLYVHLLYLCVRVCVLEIDGDRQRHRERETDRDTETETHTETHTEIERQSETQRERERDTERDTQREKDIEGENERNRERQCTLIYHCNNK